MLEASSESSVYSIPWWFTMGMAGRLYGNGLLIVGFVFSLILVILDSRSVATGVAHI